MLVLSRRRDETIMIGDDVEITVVDIKGDTVRLGINAPRFVTVHRKEIYDAIKAENIENMKKQQVPNAAAMSSLTQLMQPKLAGDAISKADKLSSLVPTVKPQIKTDNKK